jgi:hypothetical protein
MNEIHCDYSIRFGLPSSPDAPVSIGAKFVETLDALNAIEPEIFGGWRVMDFPARSSLRLAAARDRMTSIIERNVSRDDLGNPAPVYGYTADAFTEPAVKSRRVSLWIKAGGIEKTLNSLKTGGWQVLPDPAIVTYPLFKAALLAIHSIWLTPWACAQAFRSNTLKVPTDTAGGYRLESLPMIPADPSFPDSIFHIPWFAYLSAPMAAGVKLPPEIQTETTADGGLLMTATEERLDPDIPEHARRARILAETLIAQAGCRRSTAAN